MSKIIIISEFSIAKYLWSYPKNFFNFANMLLDLSIKFVQIVEKRQ